MSSDQVVPISRRTTAQKWCNQLPDTNSIETSFFLDDKVQGNHQRLRPSSATSLQNASMRDQANAANLDYDWLLIKLGKGYDQKGGLNLAWAAREADIKDKKWLTRSKIFDANGVKVFSNNKDEKNGKTSLY